MPISSENVSGGGSGFGGGGQPAREGLRFDSACDRIVMSSLFVANNMCIRTYEHTHWYIRYTYVSWVLDATYANWAGSIVTSYLRNPGGFFFAQANWDGNTPGHLL